MRIRTSTKDDPEAIRNVHLNAFSAAEGPEVAELALKLLEDPTAEPQLSLVAEEHGKLIGHVLFTAATIANHEKLATQIMAPLGVAPAQQGKGIGTRLIETGLQWLRDNGTQIVLVYGDPNYYSRTGFTTEHRIAAPYPLQHPHGWMAQALVAGALTNIEGRLSCADALSAPEYW